MVFERSSTMNIQEKLKQILGKEIAQASNEEIYYALLTITMMLALVLLKVDYGPMKLHEENARKGDLYTTPDRPYADADSMEIKGKGKVMDLVVPILSLIVFCVIGMIYTGGFFDGVGFIEAFSNSDASEGLAMGSFFGLLCTIIIYLARKILTFEESLLITVSAFLVWLKRFFSSSSSIPRPSSPSVL